MVMNNINYTLLIVSVLFFLGCERINETGTDAPTFKLENPDTLSLEDYEIYSTLLKEENSSVIAICQKTKDHFKFSDNYKDRTSFNSFIKDYDDYDTLLFKNYIEFNMSSYVLDSIFSVNNKEILLISNDEVNSYFDSFNYLDNLKEFQIKYSDSTRLIYFSRVSTNEINNQAILEISEILSGRLIYLRKENNEWKIIGTIMAWIS